VAAAKKEEKAKNGNASRVHTTKLEQSVSLDIYGQRRQCQFEKLFHRR
jgi:hypothetical protein